MIAVTFALKSESADFLRLLQEKRTAAGQHAITGALGRHQISVLHSGVGGREARARVSTFLRHHRPDFLLSSGFAGALHDGWRPGQLLLAENFSAPTTYATARTALENIARPGKLMTATSIVDSADARLELARLHGVDAVDMETEVIAEVCAAKRIPMLSLRVISDTPSSPFPAPPEVLFNMDRQRTDLVTLGVYIVRHPTAVAKLIRFGRQIAAARAALADGLQRLLSEPAFAEF